VRLFRRNRSKRAEEFGDKGMVVQLEYIVRDETGHLEETERLLRDWPLQLSARRRASRRSAPGAGRGICR
jgi:hypothetical protein